jgi:hypothetical protein
MSLAVCCNADRGAQKRSVKHQAVEIGVAQLALNLERDGVEQILRRRCVEVRPSIANSKSRPRLPGLPSMGRSDCSSVV